MSAAYEVSVTIRVVDCKSEQEAEDYVRDVVGSEPGFEVTFASGRTLRPARPAGVDR